MGNKVVSWGGGALSGSQGGRGCSLSDSGATSLSTTSGPETIFSRKVFQPHSKKEQRIAWSIVHGLNVIYDATFGFFCSLW